MPKKIKNSDYFNIPLDHPDVELIRKMDEEDSGLKYNEEEILSMHDFKSGKKLRRSKKDNVNLPIRRGKVKSSTRTSNMPSFKGSLHPKIAAKELLNVSKGGLIQGKPKLAKKGWK